MIRNVKNINAQVRSLEEELKALKTLIKYPAKVEKTFASLRGIWKGKSHFTMDEIKKAEIQVKVF